MAGASQANPGNHQAHAVGLGALLKTGSSPLSLLRAPKPGIEPNLQGGVENHEVKDPLP